MAYLRWALRSAFSPNLDELQAVRGAMRATRHGVLVDVGAHHGSSLLPFATDGWRVHAFEPDPGNRAVLETRTRSFDQVTVDARAIGPRDGEVVTLFTSPVSSGISTTRPFDPSHRPTAEVTTVRLDTYLADVPEVTVLKTDAEGQDLPILETFPWDRLRPAAVVAEFEDRKTAGPVGYTFHDLATYLGNYGYTVLISEWYPVVRYGAKHRWRRIERYPTELADSAAWGNVVAIVPTLASRVIADTSWPARWRVLARKIRRRAGRGIGRG